jgi:HSP20 family protein
MSLIWTPRDLEHFFDSAFNGTALNQRASHDDTASVFRPRMNVHEDNEKNVVTATLELPGLKKDDIAIDVQNGRLTISGQTTTSTEENKDGYVVRERRSGKFSRVLGLPNGVQAESVNAALNDGILTVTWPKTTPEQQAKRVTVG